MKYVIDGLNEPVPRAELPEVFRSCPRCAHRPQVTVTVLATDRLTIECPTSLDHTFVVSRRGEIRLVQDDGSRFSHLAFSLPPTRGPGRLKVDPVAANAEVERKLAALAEMCDLRGGRRAA